MTGIRIRALMIPEGFGSAEAELVLDVDGRYRRMLRAGIAPIWRWSWKVRVAPGPHTMGVAQQHDGRAITRSRRLSVEVPTTGWVTVLCLPRRDGSRLITRRNPLERLVLDPRHHLSR
jgi:hypothetical protein